MAEAIILALSAATLGFWLLSLKRKASNQPKRQR